MAESTGIVLTATAISFGNEYINSGSPNFRIPVAGLAVSLLFAGIERISVEAGRGLAYIMLVTVLFAPIGGKSPAANIGDWLVNGGSKNG